MSGAVQRERATSLLVWRVSPIVEKHLAAKSRILLLLNDLRRLAIARGGRHAHFTAQQGEILHPAFPVVTFAVV